MEVGKRNQKKKILKRQKKFHNSSIPVRNKLEVFPTTALGKGAFYTHQMPV